MEEVKVFKCKTCAEPLDIRTAKDGIIECKYCSTVHTLPKDETSPEALYFLRMGEHDLDTADWDGALSAYSKACEKAEAEPEAYWGLALAGFKVQYIKDLVNNRLQPVCHEISTRRFSESADYQRALKLATPAQRSEYKRKAAEIDYIKGEFYNLSQSGLDYDCFICVKVTDKNGNKTEDYKDAEYIYDLLKNKGYSPFFVERSIRNHTRSDYEAMILYALHTSETMLVVCRREEYLHTSWVKNEYTRFLRLVNDEEKESDSITIVYYEKPIDHLPGRRGELQGIDFSRIGADSQILDFVEKHTHQARARREAAKSSMGGFSMEEMFARFKEMECQQAEEAKRKAEEEARKKADLEINDGVLVVYKGAGGDVIIPEGVTSIDDSAFRWCSSLTSITIPYSVISIGGSAFYECSSLTRITIPDSVTSIGDYAFLGCEGLTSITIPTSVTSIGEGAFNGCRGLTSITIPNSVKSIGKHVFTDCKSLTSITIPDSVTSIGDSAFAGCKSLTSITIPDSVTSIGDSAFAGCNGLTSITIPDSVTSIGEDAFRGCNMTSLTIPDSVTSIGKGAFCGCTNLTSVTMPKALKGKRAEIFPKEILGLFSKCKFIYT